MPHPHPRTWALLALLLLLPAVVAAATKPARAACVSPTSCLCVGYSQRIVVQAKVLALQGEGAVVAIEAIDNPTAATTTLAEGATATLAYAADYAVGDRFLGFADANYSTIYAIVHIDADERVTCKYAPTFRPTVAEARAIMAAADCSAALVAQGFPATGCVGSGVTRIGDEGGCSAGRGAGGLGGGVALVVGLLSLLWRRAGRRWPTLRLAAAVRSAACVLLGVLAACGSSQGPAVNAMTDVVAQDAAPDAPADVDAGASDMPPDAVDAKPDNWGCHTDCFGKRSCSMGKVRDMKPEAIPCGTGKSCQFTDVYTCKEGCNPYPKAGGGYPDPASLCAEYPKLPGDRCDNDAQCQPVGPPAGATTTDATLTCHLGFHACVSSAQPALPDYLSSCGLAEDTFAASKSDGSAGFADIGACSAKTCLISFTNPSDWPRSGHCLAQGCSTLCKTSWDCPQGARCAYASSIDIDLGVYFGAPAAGGDVCLPVKYGQAGLPSYGCKDGI